MSVTRSIILLGLVARVLAQSQSSSDQTFSIQTDPATPTSSASPSSSSSSSSASDQISAGLFPQACVSTCAPLADTFLNCGLSDLAGFNVSCLCTVEVEKTFVNCVECALGAESNPQGAVATYQSLIDAYLQQCSMASTTLPNATVQVPSSSMSPSGSVTGSSASSASLSRSSSSMSSTSSAVSSMSSSASGSASASSSSGQSTTSAPSSASSAAASVTPSNTASRGVDGRWMWGLTGVGGVVIAAALGV